jgi:hypothetical protein
LELLLQNKKKIISFGAATSKQRKKGFLWSCYFKTKKKKISFGAGKLAQD